MGPAWGRRTFAKFSLGTRSGILKHIIVPLPLFTHIHEQIKQTTVIQYQHYSIFSLPFHRPFKKERQDNSVKPNSKSTHKIVHRVTLKFISIISFEQSLIVSPST